MFRHVALRSPPPPCAALSSSRQHLLWVDGSNTSRDAGEAKAEVAEAPVATAIKPELADDADLADEFGVELKDRAASKDTLVSLKDALRPVEKYAVRWLEQASIPFMGMCTANGVDRWSVLLHTNRCP